MLTYGVEIECIVPTPRDGNYREIGAQRGPQVAAAIEAKGVACWYAGYTHTTDHRRWKIVTDGSLRVPTGYTGLEIVSPPLADGPEGFETIGKVCDALRELGATVNRSCGLHVHVSARHLSLAAQRKLAVLYADHEDVIDSLVPRSRRGTNNAYTLPVKGLEFSKIVAAQRAEEIASAIRFGARHVKLNFNAFFRYGTVEFRHHSGTVDTEKIAKWVNFCIGMVQAAERTAHEPLVTTVQPTMSEYWRHGRRTQAIFRLLTRPEGVTSEEARIELGVRSRPNIRWHLVRAGAPVAAIGRRQGREVFRLGNQPQQIPVQRPTPTLESLLDLLALSDDDKAFWTTRRNSLLALDQGATLSDILGSARETSVEHLP